MKADYRLEQESKILPPTEGWKEHTYYLVEVSYRPSNPVHLAIFAVGFLREGVPGNYSEVWTNTYDSSEPFSKVHYLKVLKELVTID